jgi:hypothetical protein
MFPLSELEKRFWFLLAGSALAIGIYFRFLSFWVWPLATDEYFIYRSMSFILDSGIPEFPCGGYYSRGLLYQYVTIPLLAIGISPEASIRLVAILSNLAMLPAAYLLARRIGGIRLAAVIVTILALSTWEIELARFGRMYAPFQAVFLWYVYHAYCLIQTDDHRHWRWLLGLSLVAPLVWEGGITVALLNFLPILMRRTSWRFGHLVAAVIIFSTAVIFLQTDFRTMGPASADHPPIVELSAADSVAPQGKFSFLGPQLVEAPVLGSILVVLSLILVAGFARLLPAYKSESRAIVTLFMLTACILLNQILLAVMVFLGASLVNWFRLQDVLLPRYRRIFLPLCGMLVIWIAVALGFQTEEIPISGPKALIKGLLPLISFPDLIDSFLYPWLLSIPLMLVVLLFGSGLALANSLFSRNYEYSGIRLLLSIVIVSLTVIGAVTIRYTETRYSFHLYPLLVILSLFGFAHFMIGSTKTERLVKRWAPLVFLCLFFLSSDFALDHMVRIGTYDANFRIGYSSARAQHYYQRFDFKSPADFVNRRAAPSDVVIMTSEVVTQYLSTSNRKMNSFVYLHKTDERYKSQACDFGNLERWTGLPLLSEVGDIEALAETNPGSRLWLVADHYALRSTLPHEYLTTVARYEQVFASPDEKFRVYLRPMRE